VYFKSTLCIAVLDITKKKGQAGSRLAYLVILAPLALLNPDFALLFRSRATPQPVAFLESAGNFTPMPLMLATPLQLSIWLRKSFGPALQ
jgi:hypothetical protein